MLFGPTKPKTTIIRKSILLSSNKMEKPITLWPVRVSALRIIHRTVWNQKWEYTFQIRNMERNSHSIKRKWLKHSKMLYRCSGPKALPQTPSHPHTSARPPSDLSRPDHPVLAPLSLGIWHQALSKHSPLPKTSVLNNTIFGPQRNTSRRSWPLSSKQKATVSEQPQGFCGEPGPKAETVPSIECQDDLSGRST